MKSIVTIKPGPKPKKDNGTPDKRRRVNPENKLGLGYRSAMVNLYNAAFHKYYSHKKYYRQKGKFSFHRSTDGYWMY